MDVAKQLAESPIHICKGYFLFLYVKEETFTGDDLCKAVMKCIFIAAK